MNQRWYDANLTLSMAISLLQNTHGARRSHVVNFLHQWLEQYYPDAISQVATQTSAPKFWGFIQKRTTLDEHCWTLIEALRFIPEDKRDLLALELIHYIYCLDHDDFEHLIPTDSGKLYRAS